MLRKSAWQTGRCHCRRCPTGEKIAAAIKLLDVAVTEVHDINGTTGVHRNALRNVETALAIAEHAPLGEKAPAAVKLLDVVR